MREPLLIAIGGAGVLLGLSVGLPEKVSSFTKVGTWTIVYAIAAFMLMVFVVLWSRILTSALKDFQVDDDIAASVAWLLFDFIIPGIVLALAIGLGRQAAAVVGYQELLKVYLISAAALGAYTFLRLWADDFLKSRP